MQAAAIIYYQLDAEYVKFATPSPAGQLTINYFITSFEQYLNTPLAHVYTSIIAV